LYAETRKQHTKGGEQMKNIIIVMMVAALVFAIGSAVYAFGNGDGMHYFADQKVDIDKVKKFQKETSTLRDELIVKKLEVRQEYSKEKPDLDRIATLKKGIIDLHTKIQKSAEANGLPAYGAGHGMKGRKMGHGIMGKGMMQGNCPMLSQ
jgi:cell division protein YceG involved in septum cleavage